MATAQGSLFGNFAGQAVPILARLFGRQNAQRRSHSFRLPESTIALCLNHSDGRRKSVTRGYIKPSAAVQRARELAKLELKRAAFNQWAERLREIIG